MNPVAVFLSILAVWIAHEAHALPLLVVVLGLAAMGYALKGRDWPLGAASVVMFAFGYGAIVQRGAV